LKRNSQPQRTRRSVLAVASSSSALVEVDDDDGRESRKVFDA